MKRGWVLVGLALAGCAHPGSIALTDRERAQVFVAQNQPEKAIPLLEALHLRTPNDLSIARSLTEAHLKAGRADALIARLVSAKADTPVAHYMLGLAYFARSAEATGAAQEELERAIALAPREAELHYRLGLVLLESERYAAALAPLSQALALDPRREAIHLPLAKAFARAGDPVKAVAQLRELTQGAPSPSEVTTARALMAEIADPFARFPKAGKAKLEEGMTWLEDRDVPQQAIVAFEEILRDFPDLSAVHALLGLAYQRIDDSGRAIEEYRRAIELAPYDGKNHLYLGELYLGHQRPRPAQEEFEKAIALHPLLDDAYLHLGDLALEKRNLDQAQEIFRVLSHLEPDAIAPRGKLALVLQLKQDWKGADRELRRVVEKDPENVEFLLRLGVLHTERYQQAAGAAEKRSAAAEATLWLEQVLQRQPENALASRELQTVRGR